MAVLRGLSGGQYSYLAMALSLFLPSLLFLVALTEQTVNLNLGNGVKKAPTPYLGAAGLTPFLGFNPYARSIGPMINLDLPHFDVKKVPSAYIGANGLLMPYVGINPYLRSIAPPAGSFSPAMMPYGPAATRTLPTRAAPLSVWWLPPNQKWRILCLRQRMCLQRLLLLQLQPES